MWRLTVSTPALKQERVADDDRDAELLGAFDEFLTQRRVGRDWLLDQKVFARFDERQRDVMMQCRRNCDDRGIHGIIGQQRLERVDRFDVGKPVAHLLDPVLPGVVGIDL